MTFEEAKKIFLNRGYIEVPGGTYYDADKWRESITVISKWLEQEPCEDCVSRQTVIDMMNYGILEDNIKNLPPVIPKENAEWIPVSEKLPEESKRYMVTTKYNDVMTDFYTGEIFLQGDDIIAWMLIPKPYEPQESKVSE